MAIQSSGPLESAGMPVTNAGRASSGQNKTSSAGRFWWNICGLKQQSTASSMRGSRWRGNRERGGRWGCGEWSSGRSGRGEVSTVGMAGGIIPGNGIFIRCCCCWAGGEVSTVSHVDSDAEWPHDIHPNEAWGRFQAYNNNKTSPTASFAPL